MQQIRQCIEEFAHGATQKSLAEKFGVKQPTVSYWVHAFGTQVLGPKFKARKQGRPQLKEPNARDKKILARVAAGERYSDLAKVFGISSARIGSICTLWVSRGYRPSGS